MAVEGSNPLVFALVEDITEYKQTEAALRRVSSGRRRMYAFDLGSANRGDSAIGSLQGWCLNWMDDPNTSRESFETESTQTTAMCIPLQTGSLLKALPIQTSFRVLRPDGSAIWLKRTRGGLQTP